MKLVFLAFAAVIGVSAVASDEATDAADGPRAAMRELPLAEPADCADRIERVRDELDQPKLDRQPASAERPLFIAAVDKRVDGCAVLQMKGNVNDLRPLPQAPQGPVTLVPAR